MTGASVTVTSTVVAGHGEEHPPTRQDGPDGAAAAVVTASPAFGTADLSPNQPVTVTVTNGTLDAVTMTAADGSPVTGAMSADRGTWTVGRAAAVRADLHGDRDRDRRRRQEGADLRDLLHGPGHRRGAEHGVPG